MQYLQKFVFPHRRYYGTQKPFWQENLTRGTYLSSIIIFQQACGELECLEQVVVGQKCFLQITFVEHQFGTAEFFLRFLRSFELSSSLIAHLFKGKWRVGHGYALPAFSS